MKLAIQERKKIIANLESKLNSRLLTIVTGDRQGMETRIAPDILSLVSEHLSNIGTCENLAIFLYTPGGDTIVGWGLVNLLRQYCKKLKVLVPFQALSCGTLIALGADEIVMGKHGLLSPVDPSVSSPFNPPAPGIQQPGAISLLPVSVEDMIGFLDLAKKEIGLKSEESMVSILKVLADKVHPLALGAVYRAREQTSSLAKRLLLTHSSDGAKIDRIVKRLTQELPTHNYLIGRAEAENDIKLDICKPSDDVDEMMWALYEEYEHWLQLTSPFSAELDLGTDQRKRIRYERAAVESMEGNALYQHIFITDNELFRINAMPAGMQDNVTQAMVRTLFLGWIAAKDGEVL
jgi:hypothetical protein